MSTDSDTNPSEDQPEIPKVNLKYESINILKNSLKYCIYVILTYIILSLFSYNPDYGAGGISWSMIIIIYIGLCLIGIMNIKYEETYWWSIGILLVIIWIVCCMWSRKDPNIYGAGTDDNTLMNYYL